MDWMTLVFGLVLGSCVTSALIWAQRGTLNSGDQRGYFTRVALSAVLTAVLAGLVRTGIDYGTSGSLTTTGIWFGTGWLMGGLLAGWFLSGPMRRT
jgi:hypothetical protein